MTLVGTIGGLDWNRGTAPLEQSGGVQNAVPFAGDANDYLRLLTGRFCLPWSGCCPAHPAGGGIAGYSLAGLLVVYALYRADMFFRTASVSGSL